MLGSNYPSASAAGAASASQPAALAAGPPIGPVGLPTPAAERSTGTAGRPNSTVLVLICALAIAVTVLSWLGFRGLRRRSGDRAASRALAGPGPVQALPSRVPLSSPERGNRTARAPSELQIAALSAYFGRSPGQDAVELDRDCGDGVGDGDDETSG